MSTENGNTEIIINHELGVAYVPGTKTALSFPGEAKDVKKPHTTPFDDITETDAEIAFWGANNDYPQTIINYAKGTFIPEALDRKVRFLYSCKPYWVKLKDIDAQGNEVYEKTSVKDPWNKFINSAAFDRYRLEAITDLYWFFNIFPELNISVDRKNILSITTQDASFCRWTKQDDNGKIKACHINANWPDNQVDLTDKIPTFDRYAFNAVDAVRNSSAFNIIYPLSYPTPGKVYYQLAHWHHVVDSKWLDVLKAVPIFKKALMDNQLSIKYHISVPSWWWNWKYPGFHSKSPEDKKTIRTDELTAFSDFFKGTNQGNTLWTDYYSSPEMGKEYASWQINVLDNKTKDGMYIEDSQEASSYMLYCLGLDEGLFGKGPGKGMGSGSGSDKLVAFNAYMATIAPHLDCIYEPLRFIQEYNGWDEDLVLRFKVPNLERLKTNAEIQQMAIPKTETEP
jgi:hypothetical protein